MARPKRPRPPKPITYRRVPRCWCERCRAWIEVQPCPACALRDLLATVGHIDRAADQPDGPEIILPPRAELPAYDEGRIDSARLAMLANRMQDVFIGPAPLSPNHPWRSPHQ